MQKILLLSLILIGIFATISPGEDLVIFSARPIFYVLDYEGYEWNPCYGNTCLAVNCPRGTCSVETTHYIVRTRAEAQEILNNKGIEHLQSVYQIEWDMLNKKAVIRELQVISHYELIHKEDPEIGTFSTSSESSEMLKFSGEGTAIVK